ncbi:hypothetical protein ACFX1W_020415 [Malus domestica]
MVRMVLTTGFGEEEKESDEEQSERGRFPTAIFIAEGAVASHRCTSSTHPAVIEACDCHYMLGLRAPQQETWEGAEERKIMVSVKERGSEREREVKMQSMLLSQNQTPIPQSPTTALI